MITHKIEIEGAPEGWEVKRIGIPRDGECYLANGDVVSFMAGVTVPVFRIILQRTTERSCVDTKPRRIVLEETNEERRICYGEWYESQEGKLMRWPYGGKTDGKHRVWREVNRLKDKSYD